MDDFESQIIFNNSSTVSSDTGFDWKFPQRSRPPAPSPPSPEQSKNYEVIVIAVICTAVPLLLIALLLKLRWNRIRDRMQLRDSNSSQDAGGNGVATNSTAEIITVRTTVTALVATESSSRRRVAFPAADDIIDDHLAESDGENLGAAPHAGHDDSLIDAGGSVILEASEALDIVTRIEVDADVDAASPQSVS